MIMLFVAQDAAVTIVQIMLKQGITVREKQEKPVSSAMNATGMTATRDTKTCGGGSAKTIL